jgi:hypothetical protein
MPLFNPPFQSNGITPSDLGYAAWTFDPASCAGGTALPTAGSGFGSAFVIRSAVTISEMLCHVVTIGSVLTTNECFLSVYSAAGALLGYSADQSVNWATQGVNGAAGTWVALTAESTGTLTLSPGSYWAVAHFNGTTGPALARSATLIGDAIMNAGIASAANYRAGTVYTGATTAPPASFTPASVISSTGPYYFAVK